MIDIVVSALLSAFVTLLVVALWGHFYFLPRLKRDLQKEMDEQAYKAARLISESVEDAVKKGLVDGVRSLPTREVIEHTSRSLAKSSSEIVGDRLGKFFGRREKKEGGES